MDNDNGDTGSVDVVLVVLVGGEECACQDRSTDGPARVNSSQYQAGWDRIFGNRQEERVLN